MCMYIRLFTLCAHYLSSNSTFGSFLRNSIKPPRSFYGFVVTPLIPLVRHTHTPNTQGLALLLSVVPRFDLNRKSWQLLWVFEKRAALRWPSIWTFITLPLLLRKMLSSMIQTRMFVHQSQIHLKPFPFFFFLHSLTLCPAPYYAVMTIWFAFFLWPS